MIFIQMLGLLDIRGVTRCLSRHLWSVLRESGIDTHGPLYHNAVFLNPERVAVTLYYLGQGGTYQAAGLFFGMGKSSVIRFIEGLSNLY